MTGETPRHRSRTRMPLGRKRRHDPSGTCRGALYRHRQQGRTTCARGGSGWAPVLAGTPLSAIPRAQPKPRRTRGLARYRAPGSCRTDVRGHRIIPLGGHVAPRSRTAVLPPEDTRSPMTVHQHVPPVDGLECSRTFEHPTRRNVSKPDREIIEILETFDLTRCAHSAAALAACDPRSSAATSPCAKAAEIPSHRPSRARAIDPIREKVEELVDRSRTKVRADKVHDHLVAMGFGGDKRSTHRAVAEARRPGRPGMGVASAPWVPGPAICAQVRRGRGTPHRRAAHLPVLC